MPLERQVCSLELAKKLKELGVKQDSAFYWGRTIHDEADELHFQTRKIFLSASYSAFTVPELGDMLPDYIGREHLYSLQIFRSNAPHYAKHRVSYWFFGSTYLHEEDADTEADARAAMLVYLLENKLVELP